MSSAVDIVQRQLDAYNVQDLDGYCACFAPDVVISDLNGAVTQDGLAAVRDRYGSMFAQYPKNQARLIHRIAQGDVVIDHEEVRRDPDQPAFIAVAIYTIKNGLIARVDFVR